MKRWMWVSAVCVLAMGFVGCAEDEPMQGCACTEDGCPENQCDVSVTLAENCRGKLDSAEVEIDGVIAGEATVDAPFRSCEAYACDASVQMVVRNTAVGFTTGSKTVTVFLEPDVPIDCSNLP